MKTPGQYRIERQLGAGATAEVFAAVKADTLERIALKVFSPVVLKDPEAVKRLGSEIDSLQRLRHPNVVSLLGVCAVEEFFALELELVDGCDLGTWQKEHGLSLLEPKLWILAQIARGLGAAHEAGVLHRDLKPENVLVDRSGAVKLTDFGLSRSLSRLTLTRMGVLVGSLGYMAPECINGLRADVKSDLFSLGVIAYELITGRAPYAAESPQALIKKVTDGNFTPVRDVNPTVPAEISVLIESCLSTRPESRPESVWTIEAALMNHLQGSRLLGACKALVSTEGRSAALLPALELKRAAIHERIARERASIKSQASTQARKSLLASMNELRSLFPEDPLVADALSELTGHKRGSIERAAAFTRWAGALAVLLAGVWWVGYQLRKPVTPTFALATPTPTTAPTPLPEIAPAVAAIEPPVRPTVLPKKIVRKKVAPAVVVTAAKKTWVVREAPTPHAWGRLVFQADEDVEIYVDDRLVSEVQRPSYLVPTGTRKIRLVKDGFKPIENTVDVVAGKTTLIRARR